MVNGENLTFPYNFNLPLRRYNKESHQRTRRYCLSLQSNSPNPRYKKCMIISKENEYFELGLRASNSSNIFLQIFA